MRPTQEDLAPRVVEVPADLAAALDPHPEARRFFDALPYSQQRWFVLGIDDAKIVAAETKDREVLITVRIVSQLISAVTSATGEVIDGDPETVVEVKDVWTFARDTR